jgi:hypothetical protein
MDVSPPLPSGVRLIGRLRHPANTVAVTFRVAGRGMLALLPDSEGPDLSEAERSALRERNVAVLTGRCRQCGALANGLALMVGGTTSPTFVHQPQCPAGTVAQAAIRRLREREDGAVG